MPKEISINMSNKIAFITSYNVTIMADAKQRGRFIKKKVIAANILKLVIINKNICRYKILYLSSKLKLLVFAT